MSAGTRILVFDFDGVLVDSNQLKQKLFLELYLGIIESWPERMGDVLARLPYGTRYDLLRLVFQEMGLNEVEIEQRVHMGAALFEERLKAGMTAAKPLVRETLAVLSKQYPCFLNSATPTVSLRASLERLGLVGCFEGVYGAERTKVENLQLIRRLRVGSISELVFIGDGLNDLAAAHEVGCGFIGVPNEVNGWRTRQDFPILLSFDILPQLVSDYFSSLL